MTEELQFIVTITIVFLAFIFWVSNRPRKSLPNSSRILDTLDLIAEDIQQLKNNKTKTTSKGKTKSNEIIDTLDWMLAHSIITPEEYTKLMGKCLQYM
jgi:hypothetical protein